MRQFYGHPEKMRSFCKKNHVHKIPCFRGGGVFLGFLGGGADFIFMGARIFLRKFQARLRIRLPLWGIIKVRIEIFKRD